MSGCVDWNFPAFDFAAKELRELGWRVINPADFGAKLGTSWAGNLARDLPLIPCADVVCTLPGWTDSNGATLECTFAFKAGIPCYAFHKVVAHGTAKQFMQEIRQGQRDGTD